MYNPNAHTCITCFLQIATPMASYVIDVLVSEVWHLVSLLDPIIADPKLSSILFFCMFIYIVVAVF
jgi:hypothetical protein